MHTLSLPKGIPTKVWCALIQTEWLRAFEQVGFSCIEVWTKDNCVILYDPHKHLHNNAAIGLIVRDIIKNTEENLALILCETLLLGR